MVTAYDYPSAVHVDQSGFDCLLVGDSAAMVVHGHNTTQPFSLDEMITHCKAVARGCRNSMIIGDLPFGSYELSIEQGVNSALRLVKEGNVDAVKLEGGSKKRCETVRAIVETGIAVIGHVGLTPQAIGVLGGFRPQGQNFRSAKQVIQQAIDLQNSGCFAIVLECVPAIVGQIITKLTSIPTIGIGAGPFVSGQVLVYHDVLDMASHPHHIVHTPKFCKKYGQIGLQIQEALSKYKDEVESKAFPSTQHSPYKMTQQDADQLLQWTQQQNLSQDNLYESYQLSLKEQQI